MVWHSAEVDVAVIGLGLIGGSAVRALAAAGHRIIGYDADPATRAVARTAAARAPLGARWQVAGTVADAIAGTDVTVVAVPAPVIGGVFDQITAAGYSGLVTDVTSVKGPVRAVAAKRLRTGGAAGVGATAGVRFVGGHPMAGRETSGFEAGDPELLRGCAWVLCLEPGETDLTDWLALARLVTGLGSRVVPSTAADHDRAVAAVSHLPHLLASALASGAGSDPLALTLAAGSFRDGTRVAASRPELVAAMCGGNAEAVRDALDTVLAELRRARAALDAADPAVGLVPWLSPGCLVRRGWPVPPLGEPVTVPAEVGPLLRLGQLGGWVTGVADDGRTVTADRPGPDGSPAGR